MASGTEIVRFPDSPDLENVPDFRTRRDAGRDVLQTFAKFTGPSFRLNRKNRFYGHLHISCQKLSIDGATVHAFHISESFDSIRQRRV